MKIALVGEVGNDPTSELAVDDLQVEQEPCAPRGKLILFIKNIY